MFDCFKCIPVMGCRRTGRLSEGWKSCVWVYILKDYLRFKGCMRDQHLDQVRSTAIENSSNSFPWYTVFNMKLNSEDVYKFIAYFWRFQELHWFETFLWPINNQPSNNNNNNNNKKNNIKKKKTPLIIWIFLHGN